ncbi:hypothetical protein EV649_7042 [Kribbella sp. VKM Ac-2569]|uniref:hypothetical protein n=1 Tax=Kribbella sp. VKM Ac-2569 TaxID=2512220 RepID=UPI00102BB9FD|nr:hypothetical protein [Kribbella sp. VKM Ac-2569]RZT12677.1 hypothetical protein EV649_7042 [Kribbella sp. VKM Ac-2569]
MRKRRAPIRPRRRTGPPLSQADRARCDLALAELYFRREIDKTQLSDRLELLERARTRGDLKQVFEGVPFPVLSTPARAAKSTARAKSTVRRKSAVKFAAEPAQVDRELVVNLAKILGVGVVFAGVIILTNPSMVLLLVLLVVVGGNMFLAYRDWAKKRRSK